MSEKPRIWNGKDGKLYRNDGPINPVADKEAAHSMAIAGEKARQEHAEAVDKVNNAPTGAGAYPVNFVALEKLAAADVDTVADRVEERVRSNIGGQDTDRAKTLFNLVELKAVLPPEQQPTGEDAVQAPPPPETNQ